MEKRIRLGLVIVGGLLIGGPGVCNGQTNPGKDFTTPWAAVETMLRAAKAKDVETLSHCFHDRTEPAFEPYRDGRATARQLDLLAEWAWNAYVTDVKMSGVRAADVSVRFPPADRPGALELVRTAEGWKIARR